MGQQRTARSIQFLNRRLFVPAPHLLLGRLLANALFFGGDDLQAEPGVDLLSSRLEHLDANLLLNVLCKPRRRKEIDAVRRGSSSKQMQNIQDRKG